MWNTGATQPNFFFVKVSPGTSGGDLSNSLQFQTYVANRGAISASSAGAFVDEVESTAGGTGGATSASYLTVTPASRAYSNRNKTTTFTLTNNSSTPLGVTSVSAVGANGVKITNLTINSIALYNNNKGSTTVTVANASTLLPGGLAAGPVSMSVTGNGALLLKTITIAITFSDNSVATTTVKP